MLTWTIFDILFDFEEFHDHEINVIGHSSCKYTIAKIMPNLVRIAERMRLLRANMYQKLPISTILAVLAHNSQFSHTHNVEIWLKEADLNISQLRQI